MASKWLLLFAVTAAVWTGQHHFARGMDPKAAIRNMKTDVELAKSLVSNVDEMPSNDEVMRRLQKFMNRMSSESDVGAMNSSLSEACAGAMTRLVADYQERQSYARQMLVSFGNRVELFRQFEYTFVIRTWGLFDTCRNVKPSGDRTFGGKYCMFYPSIGIEWGVCFPDSCSSAEVTYLIQESGLASGGAYCVEDQSLRTGDYVAIVICSIIVGLMILGTVYDVLWNWSLKRKIKRSEEIANLGTMKQELVKSKSSVDDLKKKRPGILGRILISFSVVTNGRKLLQTGSGGSGTVSSLNGVRVLSMMWVIIGHTYAFTLGFFDNYRYVFEEVYPRWSMLGIYAGVYGVDTFFLLSGCLVAYLTLKQLSKTNGSLNWLLYYFHRWWRLTPAFGLTLLIWSTVSLYFASGPIYDQYMEGSQAVCQEYWWAAIFYFNNFVPWIGNTGEICMGWTWYLHTDMQLFVLSPFFIIILYKSAKVGTFTVASFAVASMATVAGLATYYGYTLSYDAQEKYNTNLPAGDDFLYTMPWTRLQSYLVGIYLGYVLYRLNGQKIKINKVLNLIIWLVALGMMAGVVYGQYPVVSGKDAEQWAAVLYTSVGAFVFVTGVAWVIFACSTGNGGPVNTLLSWSAWSPLSRLTYCAYLVHPIIMFVYTWSAKKLFHFTDMTMALYYVAFLTLSYAAAFILSLAIEAPMIALEKIIFRR